MRRGSTVQSKREFGGVSRSATDGRHCVLACIVPFVELFYTQVPIGYLGEINYEELAGGNDVLFDILTTSQTRWRGQYLLGYGTAKTAEQVLKAAVSGISRMCLSRFGELTKQSRNMC